MPDPGLTRPNLCSIPAAAGQAEPAWSNPRRAQRRRPTPPAGDDPAAPQPSGIDRASRVSTAAAVLAVAGIAAYVSYGHAYAVVRAHARPGSLPGWNRPRSTVWSMPVRMVVLYAARHRVPVPSLARWLLALGIAATLTANMAQGWSHGPVGAVIAAWPAVSLVGSYELPGLAHPHLRVGRPRTVGSAPQQQCGLPRCGASRPGFSR